MQSNYNLTKKIITIATPLTLASSSDVLMTLAGTAMVGHLGSTEIAATGFAGLYLWALLNLFKGIFLCVGSFVSQNHGAKNTKGIHAVITAATMIAIISSLLIGFYSIVVPYTVQLASIAPDVSLHAIEYIQIRLWGSLGFFTTLILAGYFRGTLRPKIVLYISVLINLTNISFTYIFINQFHMGVAGAAWGTVISQYIGACLYLYFFIKYSSSLINIKQIILWNHSIFKNLLKIGVPYNFKIFCEVFVFFLFTVIVGKIGTLELAATTIMIHLLSFTNMTAIGIGQAGGSIIGHYIAHKDFDMAIKTGRIAILSNFILGLVMSFFLILFAHEICSLFNSDIRVITIFVSIVMLGTLEVIGDGLQMVVGYLLEAAGDTKYQFILISLLGYAFYLPMTYILTFTLNLGLTGAWISSGVFILCLSILLILRFESKKWSKITLVLE